MNLVISGALYHGCTGADWRRIQSDGLDFLTERANQSRWLCGHGLYVFVNNPLLAYTFAIEKARISKSLATAGVTGPSLNDSDHDPVVFRVWLDDSMKAASVLDLTTPEGMEELYEAHMEILDVLARVVEGPVSLPDDTETDEVSERAILDYTGSLVGTAGRYGRHRTNRQLEALVRLLTRQYPDLDRDEIVRRSREVLAVRDSKDTPGYKKAFSYDCMAITGLVSKKRYVAVVAAIQEGILFHDMHKHPFSSPGVEGYGGLRLRDHIEACITVPKTICKCEPYVFDPAQYSQHFMRHAYGFNYHIPDRRG